MMPRPLARKLFCTLATAAVVLPSAAAAETAPPPRHEARRLGVEAIGRCQQEDFAGCREGLLAARKLWPSHFQLLYTLATAEARLGHAEAAIAVLDELAEMDLTLPAAADPSFEALREKPAFREIVRRFAAAAEPRGESAEAFRVEEPDLLAEGVTHDPKTDAFFVGAVHRRKIVRVDAEGKASDFATAERDGLRAVFALEVDAERRILWATTSSVAQMQGFTPEDDGQAALFAYNLNNARVLGRYPIPKGEAGHRLNDLALAADGGVWATDNMLGGGVWYLAPGAEDLELVSRPGQFRSPQGIVLSEDGRRLYVADYSFGILVCDLDGAKVGEFRHLEEPPGLSLIGVDGLDRHGGDLLVIQNGVRPHRILRLSPDGAGKRIERAELLVSNHPQWDEPTLGVVAGDDYFYVGNSQWGSFAEGLPREGAQLQPPVVLKLEL